MLQCGGGSNSSAALLREYFAHERRFDEACKRQQVSGKKGIRYTTGSLPVITANTDMASLRRTSPRSGRGGTTASSKQLDGSLPSARGASGHVHSPLRRMQSPRAPASYDLPNHGIGFGIDALSTAVGKVGDNTPTAGHSQKPQLPSHGQLPPYGRRAVTKEFFDDVSGGGIACLCPMNHLSKHQKA